MEVEGGNYEPGDNNKVNNVDVTIDWDKIVYNVEGYPELHPDNVILTSVVADAIDLERCYFNWVYYDEAEGGEWYTLEFDDLPDNDPMVGILVYFYPLEGYEFGNNPTVSCEDYEVDAEFDDPDEAVMVIKLGNMSTALSGIKQPVLESIDITFVYERTFGALTNGAALPDLDTLIEEMNIMSAVIKDDANNEYDVGYMGGMWMYAPIGTEDFGEVRGEHLVNTEENVYAIKLIVGSDAYMVDASTFAGPSVKDENDKAYDVCDFEFVRFEALESQNTFYAIIMPATETPAPSRPSGSTPTVDVPVSNNENKVDVKAEVSGKDATIKPLDEKQIEQLVGNENASGDVVVDLSNLGKTIDTAGIPKKTLETIVDAAEDAGNDTEHLVIKLSTAELKLDDAAMRAIVDQADGDIIKFNFDDVGLGRLNKEQKEAVKDMDVRKGYEAYITVNGQRIGDFKGGEVEIIVPYAVPAGENVAGFSVWYIDENGKPEKQKSTYDGKEKCFVVTHFSDYVIVYNEDDAQAGSYMVCTKDETCPIHPYTDASTTEWYHDGVHYCIDNGLMSGYGNGIFKPDADTTRAMITVMLWRLNGSPVVDCQLDFEDVAEGQWYTEAIRWAKSEGVATGYGNGFFGTNDAVTREQMVTILWRYAQYKGVDVSVGENTNILSYGDAFDIAEYAIPAMQWACGSGMVQGMSDTDGDGMILAPESKGTRAQIATMMMRFCENIVK